MFSKRQAKDRCRDCAYLVEGEHGEWLCSNCYYEEDVKDIFDISEDECAYTKGDESSC